MTTHTAPAAIYAALRPLCVGDAVPPCVYVADERSGARPAWTVVAREDTDADGVVLTLVDPANGDMFDQVACIVIAFPSKVLRTQLQIHGATGPAIVGNKLCDMAQQARRRAKEQTCPHTL